MIDILEKFDIGENNIEWFADNLEKGSVNVLVRESEDLQLSYLDSSQNEDQIITESNAQEVLSDDILDQSKEIFSDVKDFKAPMGSIDFTVDTQGSEFSMVNIHLAEGGTILIKYLRVIRMEM